MASKARRGISIINYMAQDLPELSVMAKVLSQRMADPTTGTEECLERTITYLVRHPRGLLVFPRGQVEKPLRCWTGSDWAGVHRKVM